MQTAYHVYVSTEKFYSKHQVQTNLVWNYKVYISNFLFTLAKVSY